MLSLVNETLRKKRDLQDLGRGIRSRCVHVGDLVKLRLTPVEEAVRCGSRRIVCSPGGYYFVKSGEMVFFPRFSLSILSILCVIKPPFFPSFISFFFPEIRPGEGEKKTQKLT